MNRSRKCPGLKPQENERLVAVCEFLKIEPRHLVKTLVYVADGETLAVLVRGDRDIEEVKLKNYLGVNDIRMAEEKEVFDATGVPTGYLGTGGHQDKASG